MRFFRNNWYWIFSIVIGLGIWSIITMHRVQQQISEPEQKMPKVAAHTPDADKPPINAAPGKTSHKTPNVEALGKRRPIRINTDARNNPALKNNGTILSADHDDVIEPSPPLPFNALQRRDLMLRSLSDAGQAFEYRDDGPYLTEVASQIELEAFTGGMNPEDAIAFLEKHGHYNEAILSQVSAHRAFKYLQTIRASWEKVNEYAEKALAENPDNFEAKMKLMLSEKDNAKAAAGYREILAKDPNHIGALLNLAYRTHYDDPEGALVHLTKANKLDPTLGWGDIGMVYERLGDVKTAWVYYRKHITLWHTDQLIRSHLSWIEIGEPKYMPIYLERQTVPARDEASKDKETGIPKGKRPPAATELPWFPKLQPDERHPSEKQQTEAEAVLFEFQRRQAAAQKEFHAFIKWAVSVMHEDSPIDTNDFLTKELAAHLKGGKTEVAPEQLVRAFEMMERYGRTSGLERLKDKDPELAAKVERFHKEKQQPSRRNNSPNKNE